MRNVTFGLILSLLALPALASGPRQCHPGIDSGRYNTYEAYWKNGYPMGGGQGRYKGPFYCEATSSHWDTYYNRQIGILTCYALEADIMLQWNLRLKLADHEKRTSRCVIKKRGTKATPGNVFGDRIVKGWIDPKKWRMNLDLGMRTGIMRRMK